MTMRRTLIPLLLLTGCSFFSRSQSKFYSLDRVAPAAAPVAGVQGVPVSIDGVELPPGLDRREIVVRKPDHQLEIRSAEQWSASLKELALHTLAFDLAARLRDGMVILPGATKPAATRSIDVVFEELAAGPDAKVVVDARWTLQGVAHHEQIAVDVPSLDSASVATGTSQAIGILADRIAAAVR